MADLSESIETNAQSPKRVKNDQTEVEMPSLSEQIEADRYLKNQSAATRGIGLRLTKLVPPGAD